MEVNRWNITYSGFSPCEILLGYQPALELETDYSSHHGESLQSALNANEALFQSSVEEKDFVILFIANREQTVTKL